MLLLFLVFSVDSVHKYKTCLEIDTQTFERIIYVLPMQVTDINMFISQLVIGHWLDQSINILMVTDHFIKKKGCYFIITSYNVEYNIPLGLKKKKKTMRHLSQQHVNYILKWTTRTRNYWIRAQSINKKGKLKFSNNHTTNWRTKSSWHHFMRNLSNQSLASFTISGVIWWPIPSCALNWMLREN